MSVTAPRERLRALLREHAVLHGEFVLSSGAKASFYLDARIVTLSHEGAPLVAQVFHDLLRDAGVDAVAGLAIGADPIVCAIAAHASAASANVDGLIVRKESKEHGTGRRVEGPWRSGMHVAVVDDTLTSGASALVAARAIEDAGGTVQGVYALIDREQGAQEAITRAGYSFTAVFTASELLEY